MHNTNSDGLRVGGQSDIAPCRSRREAAAACAAAGKAAEEGVVGAEAGGAAVGTGTEGEGVVATKMP